MKKKGVEVYFIIYLATIISFFALEGEVNNYKKRQENIILEISKDKIEQLVRIDKVVPVESEEKLTLKVKLDGFYDSKTLSGKVALEPVPSDSVKLANKKIVRYELSPSQNGERGWFQTVIPNDEFGDNKNVPYKVFAEIEVMPQFSEEVREQWIKSYKDEKVVEKLITAINRVGKVKLSKELPNSIVPVRVSEGGKVFSPFAMKIPKDNISQIEGLYWELPIFIGGVKEKEEFDFVITEGADLISANDLLISAPETRIKGMAIKNGTVRIRGTRHEDGAVSEVEFNVVVRPPIWQESPVISEIYLKESYTFNGALLDIPSENIQIQVSGSLFKDQLVIRPGSRTQVGPFDDKGNVTFQVLVNGNPVQNMTHTVEVIAPPPPDVKFVNREGTNTLVFDIITYGEFNKVKKFIKRSGIINEKAKGDAQIQGKRKYYTWLVNIDEPFDYETDPFVEIVFVVLDEYDNQIIHRNKYKYNK
jgi:hypothetical protein